jgi:hypothetical protein
MTCCVQHSRAYRVRTAGGTLDKEKIWLLPHWVQVQLPKVAWCSALAWCGDEERECEAG